MTTGQSPDRSPAANAASPDETDRGDHAGGRDAPATLPDEVADRADEDLPLDREADRLRVDGIGVLKAYADERPGGNIYITAHTVQAESISGRDIHASGQRRGGTGRAGRNRSGDDGDVLRTVGVNATSDVELERLRAVTISVRTRARAAPVLDRERLLILRGPSGAGKRAAAIELLDGFGAVLDIDPSVSLPALAEFATLIRRPEQPCYVVESLSADTASRLNDFTLRSLIRQLVDTDSRLVLTVDERVPLQPDVEARAVLWRERPEPLKALQRHLAFYLTPAMADQVMAQLPLEDLARQLAEREMRFINRFARQMAHAYRDGTDVALAVQELGLEARQRARRWFAEDRSPSEVAFLLAATVLSGCTYASVSRHAGRIERTLAELCRIDLDDHPQSPTRSSADMLSAAMAVTTEGLLAAEFGTCVTRLVRMETDALLPAVLDVVWHEHDLAAEALLRWLLDAGTEPDAEVRLRVALAAGQLADFEFATVRSRLLRPWAEHPSRLAGWTAADALGVPAAKESTAPLALGLLHHWAVAGNLQMVWTAATAFGGYVGLGRPTTALNELREIAIRHRDTMLRTVRSSVVGLFALGGAIGDDVPVVVLSALVDWLHPDFDPAPKVARVIFTDLLGVAADPAREQANRTWWNLTTEAALPLSVCMLAAALRDKEARGPAVDALFGLVEISDVNPEAYSTLEQLVLGVCAGPGSLPRDAERLRHYLTSWSQGPYPSPTAVQLLDRLSKG